MQTARRTALAAIQAVGTIASAILSLVASISSKAAVAHMATQSGVKLSMVRPYLNDQRAAAIVAAHYGEPVDLARVQVAQAVQAEMNAGS